MVHLEGFEMAAVSELRKTMQGHSRGPAKDCDASHKWVSNSYPCFSKVGCFETGVLPRPPNYPLMNPNYHIMKTVRPSIEAHWVDYLDDRLT